MERVEPFRPWLRSTLYGNKLLATVLTSQVISNVLAALLLSGFTSDWRALIIGCNLGGLGTLIASMANLISCKQLAWAYPALRTRYLLHFTLLSLLLLGVLYACAVLLNGCSKGFTDQRKYDIIHLTSSVTKATVSLQTTTTKQRLDT